MIQVGIIGGTGYTGVELLRLLAQHPKVRVHCITSRQHNGMPVSTHFPSLRGYYDLCFTAPELTQLQPCKLVFFATPHGVAMRDAEALLMAGIKVIDLSADYRIQNVAIWERAYGMKHTSPTLLKEAVYGLPELNRHAIAGARLVANPGCYPTAVQLGLLPLIKAGVRTGFIADCKSGISGAGRKAELNLLLAENSDSFKAYNVTKHRHLPEMVESLTQVAAEPIDLTFVPHLLPIIRGIHATLYADVPLDIDVQALFEAYYAHELFVNILPPGSHPATRSVRGANVCRLAVHRLPGSHKVVILSVIDNLVKGAAGQAIQNMNLMFNLPETDGLSAAPLFP